MNVLTASELSISDNLYGEYRGLGANTLPAGQCAHCALMVPGMPHSHIVMALLAADSMRMFGPQVAWFSCANLARGQFRNWERLDKDGNIFMKLSVDAEFSETGHSNTYVWKIVDRFYESLSSRYQLGVWAD